MANKKPWEGKLFDNVSRRTNRGRQEDRTAQFFTILMVAFAVIVTLIIGVSIYLSIGGSKTGEATDVFFNPGVDAVSSQASEETTVVEEETPVESTESSSSEWSGNTLSVQAGEGAGQIASRAGITIERLYELNPEFLQTGAWYANPGDVVRVD
ncbi:SAG1386/EF1546 family surface-associated protein [Streptococcus moroccensis]|uniref:RNA polymerase subunit RPABC4/transcription elongation factor Spt4 n=1 Tax=Streptococcus moroccensis TaxID=1451356 RepID=A0ABT9YW66_9STRE|nr:SAG1386/EF1546 family surface-associated protein [Streptococcus moroccensis]MDQ0223563.1 RNA polymerase subunit RPABC4/transcription elongation factor Spt4 [Streptococcus moroccensis]